MRHHMKEYKYRRIQISENYSIDGKSYSINHMFLVHRIVAEQFIPIRSVDDTQIDHLDNNPANNRWDNLQWVSHAINTRRGFAYRNAVK